MVYKHIEVKPIAGACGAEVFGVDLAKPIKRAVFGEIYKAWLKHQVVFFRDQKDHTRTTNKVRQKVGRHSHSPS